MYDGTYSAVNQADYFRAELINSEPANAPNNYNILQSVSWK